MIRDQIRPAVVMTAVLMVITGVLYPGVVTAVAQLLFPRQANGSLVDRGGRVVGSALIAQSFASDAYFHPRPSAVDYDGAGSGGTNRGPTDRGLADTLVAGSVAEAGSVDGVAPGAVPSDRATRSGSGLDPHISPANALQQVPRVARTRRASPDRVGRIVQRHVEGRLLGLIGEPRVNVLRLNLALDDELGPAGVSAP
jgi:potassium-transporting ATPase KdpC subunit